jgi:hypothetical protein
MNLIDKKNGGFAETVKFLRLLDDLLKLFDPRADG